MFIRSNKFGRRGFRPGALLRIGLLFLFGGWVIIPVLGGLFGLSVVTFGIIAGIVGEIIGGLFSSAYFSGGLVLGTVIGLVWYFYNKKNSGEETTEEETPEAGTPAEEPIIETRHYMFR